MLMLATAAAAAKSLQSCPTLCDPRDSSPPGSPVPGILQARTLEWVAISFSNAWMWKVKVKLLSRVWLLATPWTAAYKAPLSMGFSRQEYWSWVPLPSPFFCEIQPKHKAVPATVAAAVYDVLSCQSFFGNYLLVPWIFFFFFTNFLISETQVSKNYHPETLVFLITKFVFLHRITLKINQGSLWSIPNFWDSEISSNKSRYRKNQLHILKKINKKQKKRKSNI